jgi:methylated-DNA-protein-cysteine methyltransferase related protein
MDDKISTTWDKYSGRRRVWTIVKSIPLGCVTTYGSIARTLGNPRGARVVGWMLYTSPAEIYLPAHRVVNRNGELSGGWHFGHPDVMKGLLLDEGVPFKGEYQVDLDRCLWLPWELFTTPDEVNDFNLVPGSQDDLVE